MSNFLMHRGAREGAVEDLPMRLAIAGRDWNRNIGVLVERRPGPGLGCSAECSSRSCCVDI